MSWINTDWYLHLEQNRYDREQDYDSYTEWLDSCLPDDEEEQKSGYAFCASEYE